MNIILIGAGNVATHIGIAFREAGHTIVQVYSGTEKSARQLAKKLSTDFTSDIKAISKKTDIYIIALKDVAIENFIRQFNREDKIIVHTSGSMPMSVFEKKGQRRKVQGIGNFGVFYPLQTFSKNRKVDFINIPICIEASDKKSGEKLRLLARTVSKNVHMINSRQRRVLHIAAVFANNFTNHLYAVAEAILRKENLSFDILKPLIQETAEKACTGSPSAMQTGPAIRGDRKIIQKHIAYLSFSPHHQKLYQLLSQSISKKRK